MGHKEILTYLKNSKLEENELQRLCFFFTKDFTASQTAKELNLSRQTINTYYKIIRNIITLKQEQVSNVIKEKNLCQNSFFIKHIKINSNIYYFIECDNDTFLMDFDNKFYTNIKNFIKNDLEPNILKRKSNSVKVLFNKQDKKFLISNYYNHYNCFESYINERFKKFRGLNKKNLTLHLKESFYRYNHSQENLYKTILAELNLKTKTSPF